MATMVLAPSQNLNIFTADRMIANKPPPNSSNNFLKIHHQPQKYEVKNLSDPNLSITDEVIDDERLKNCESKINDDEEIRKLSKNSVDNDVISKSIDDCIASTINRDSRPSSSSNLRRNRYFSTTSITSLLQENDGGAEFRKKRHFSIESLNTCHEENNNVPKSQTMPALSSSASLGSLHSIRMDKIIRRTPSQVAPKPFKRRISDLFSLRTNDTPSLPVITVIDTSDGQPNSGSLKTQQPETPKQRTPNLFRKFGKSVPSILEVTEESEVSTKNSLTPQNPGKSTDLRKSRSFSLKGDESNGNVLKLPGPKTFPSFRRSPFSRTKFDHTSNTNEDAKKKAYKEMLKYMEDNDCKKFKLLIKRRKVDVNTLEEDMSLLHEAAYKGCPKCTKALIKTGWSTDLTDSLDWKPLHAAVAGSNLETIKILLNNGACANSVTSKGLTPLHIAVCLGDLYIVHELISHGSNPLLSTDSMPVTPFQMSINMKKTLILDYFLHQSCFLVGNNNV